MKNLFFELQRNRIFATVSVRVFFWRFTSEDMLQSVSTLLVRSKNPPFISAVASDSVRFAGFPAAARAALNSQTSLSPSLSLSLLFKTMLSEPVSDAQSAYFFKKSIYSSSGSEQSSSFARANALSITSCFAASKIFEASSASFPSTRRVSASAFYTPVQ